MAQIIQRHGTMCHEEILISQLDSLDWYAQNHVKVRSWSAHGQVRVRSGSAHGPITVSSRSGRDQITVTSRDARMNRKL